MTMLADAMVFYIDKKTEKRHNDYLNHRIWCHMKAADQHKCLAILKTIITDSPKHWKEISTAVGEQMKIKDWRDVREILGYMRDEKMIEKFPTVHAECFVTYGTVAKLPPVTAQGIAERLRLKGFVVESFTEPTADTAGVVHITDGLYVTLSPEGVIVVMHRNKEGEMEAGYDFEFIIEVEEHLGWVIYRFEEFKHIKAA